ncbi:hypothetical protein [Allokutzneria sp. NRRL B-24872]|uniref:hypothetical protein n=1 Tax=Allokutzneria sp. NRRL B-24872 TaxID=1137961 RepID=UPI000A3D6046|nr:hypothetical protein [Allokutzneria sp. NRRL B-24872]
MTTKIIGGLTAVIAAVGIMLTGATGTAHAGDWKYYGSYWTWTECESDADRFRGSDGDAKCPYNSMRDMYDLYVRSF